VCTSVSLSPSARRRVFCGGLMFVIAGHSADDTQAGRQQGNEARRERRKQKVESRKLEEESSAVGFRAPGAGYG
jgi:hypothetical protein